MPPVRKAKPENRQISKESLETTAVVSGQLDKKIKKQQQRNDDKRGIVFVKHLPHGFFEEQLKNYFEQFGAVSRVRLGRSRRTGGSKGYAFVEFEYPEVAEVAAETMDNYLMFKKVVKASYIPPEKQLFNYFKTSVRKVTNKAGKDLYVSHKTAAIQRKVKQMNNWSNKSYQNRALKKLEKVKKLNRKYAHLGIDFSKILVEPSKLDQDDKTEVAEANEEGPKTKTRENNLKRGVAEENKKSKKSKKDIELQDLLGNTINDDDSGDEDYIAPPHIDDESKDEDENSEEADNDIATSSSDAETYGFSEDSDDEEDAGLTQIRKKSKKASISLGQSVKAPKVDRFEQLIKRKPHTGGVKKTKKAIKPTIVKKSSKSNFQMTAAKEMLKTMPAKKSKSLGLKAKSAKIQKNRK
ncbi:MKI67 FHA domain-interacting nucleolar phosphoprotein [Rhagoletis pomonella]|uniref:MKI67 FHA domain-interacting nucleolar phosphoprotein n=1 Tax=Rhagoletis pomonella TaxID=28610 RepID=UPI00177BD521|nr:MKI67 FHA domain-interacting nucleolar phosphoprotein [Rhagoletis pomonella]